MGESRSRNKKICLNPESAKQRCQTPILVGDKKLSQNFLLAAKPPLLKVIQSVKQLDAAALPRTDSSAIQINIRSYSVARSLCLWICWETDPSEENKSSSYISSWLMDFRLNLEVTKYLKSA